MGVRNPNLEIFKDAKQIFLIKQLHIFHIYISFTSWDTCGDQERGVRPVPLSMKFNFQVQDSNARPAPRPSARSGLMVLRGQKILFRTPRRPCARAHGGAVTDGTAPHPGRRRARFGLQIWRPRLSVVRVPPSLPRWPSLRPSASVHCAERRKRIQIWIDFVSTMG